MKEEEYKIGEFGWFWLSQNQLDNEIATYGRLKNILNKGEYRYSTKDVVYKYFSHQNPFIKKEPTREEITAQWVKDNDLKVGDRVRVVKKSEIDKGFSWDQLMDSCIGKVGGVSSVRERWIIVIIGDEPWAYEVESLEKVKEPEYVPYSFEDREEFKNLWAIHRMYSFHFNISAIRANNIILGGKVNSITYQELFDNYDKDEHGTPFGKLKEQ